jgi:hypothetical protein
MTRSVRLYGWKYAAAVTEEYTCLGVVWVFIKSTGEHTEYFSLS